MSYSLRLVLVFVFLLKGFDSLAAVDFWCPAPSTNPTKEEVYGPMAQGNVWRKSQYLLDEKMVFVDNQLTFKVGYNVSAKECSRQIVLENEKSPGIWEGWTEVEICNPALAALFEKKKRESEFFHFEDIFPELTSMVEFLEEKGHLAEADYNACRSQGEDCNHLKSAMNLYYGKASSIKKLMRVPKRNVEYMKDEDGEVMPRFRVRLESFLYERAAVQVNGSGKQVCRMKVRHKEKYAALIKAYSWDFHYELSQSAQLYEFNDQGLGVLLPHIYKNDLESFNFLD